MQTRIPQTAEEPNDDLEVVVRALGEQYQVECSTCGPIERPTIEVAAEEIRSWHRQRHAELRTIHLTLSVEEMRALRAMAHARAQDPEDVVREILTHALEATKHRSTPRPPRLRMVS